MTKPATTSAKDDPEQFRLRTLKRIQDLTNQFLDRLEQEGAKIHPGSLAVNIGILLTKHSELTGNKPPEEVHHTAQPVHGLDQASARALLGARPIKAKPQPKPTDEPETRLAPIP